MPKGNTGRVVVSSHKGKIDYPLILVILSMNNGTASFCYGATAEKKIATIDQARIAAKDNSLYQLKGPWQDNFW